MTLLSIFAMQATSNSGPEHSLSQRGQPLSSRASGPARQKRLRIDSLVVVEGKADRRAVLNALDAPVRSAMRGPAHVAPITHLQLPQAKDLGQTCVHWGCLGRLMMQALLPHFSFQICHADLALCLHLARRRQRYLASGQLQMATTCHGSSLKEIVRGCMR